MNTEIKLEELKSDYPIFYKFFKDTLANSQSRFKDYKESRYKCYYYIGFYMLPSQKTDEYYENLFTLKFEDRLKEELKKVRVTITMVVGKFALSDQTKEIGEHVKPLVADIVSRKMYMEQMTQEDPDQEILDSIPNLDELLQKLEDEQKANLDMLEKMGLSKEDIEEGLAKGGIIDGGGFTKPKKDLSPQEMLNELIQNEDYEKAEELIKQHPELKKR